MDRSLINVMNWMALLLLLPATIILVWKVVTEKLNRKRLSSELITVLLLLSSANIGILGLNFGKHLTLSRALAIAQIVVLVLLFKRLWAPLKERLRSGV